MNSYLDQVLLEAAKRYLKSLDDEQFRELTCDLTNLHDGLICLVYFEALRRFRNPVRITADIFTRAKRTIKDFLRKMRKK